MRRTLAVGLALALLGACGGSGRTKGQKNLDELSKTISAFAESLADGKAEIEDMLEEYDHVIHNKDGDLLRHYRKFNDGLQRVTKHEKEVAERHEDLKAAAEPFFATWRKDLDEFQSEDLRRRSQERMEASWSRFESIRKTGDEVRAAYQPLVTTLTDHALYLGNDLNLEAAATLERDAAAVQSNARTLYRLIDQAVGAAARYTEAAAMGE